MSRKLRRQMERRNRIEEKKNSITLSRQDLADLKYKTSDLAIRAASEDITVTYFLALNRLFHFGPKRLEILFTEIDKMVGQINEDPYILYDFKQELRDRGVVIDWGNIF